MADVETELVVKVLNPIWRSKTETAVRLRGRIECILDWAATRKFKHEENQHAGVVTSKICSPTRTSWRR